jgi:hypothetical protein
LAAGPAATAAARNELITDIREALERVKQNATDRAELAEGLIARGDLNWQMAHLPELPGATTRPSLQLDQKVSESLDNAEAAYRQVLNDYPDQKLPVITAHFGLAAIAEDRHKWGAAADQYNAIITNATAPPSFKDEAKSRLQMLSEIETPVYIAVPTTQVTGK